LINFNYKIFQKYIPYSSLKRSGLTICVSFWMYHLTWAPSIWNTAWCAAQCFNVTLSGASHRQSSTPKPQIDASNYICRAAQLLSKLYATFSLHSIPWTSLDPVTTVLPRFIGFDVLSGSWQSMNFILPLWLSRIESSSDDQCRITIKLFLTRTKTCRY